MREILFRGKGTSGLSANEWVYGYYCKDFWTPRKGHGILPTDKECGGYVEVVPETVGQFTGLTDKNGKRIFEGDIFTYPDSSCFGVVCFGDYDHFDSHHTGFFVKWFENGKHKGFRHDIRFWMSQEAWVVGNIHDNPELLEG